MDRSRLEGIVSIKGAFSKDAEEFKLTGDLNNFTSNYYDLVNLLPGLLRDKLPTSLRDFGNLQVTRKDSSYHEFFKCKCGYKHSARLC